MGETLSAHSPREPKDRIGEGGQIALFPNEVARALDIADIQYARLRAFYLLVRNPSGSAAGRAAIGRTWARFSFTDMAALMVALTYAGGATALQPGRRLVLGELKQACASLHAQGYDFPLLQVGLVRVGRRFYADLDGVLRDVRTGQLAIRQAAESADRYFDEALLGDATLAQALHHEVEHYRTHPSNTYTLPPSAASGTTSPARSTSERPSRPIGASLSISH